MSKPNPDLYDFTNEGECSRCGGCCSDFLPLSKKEIKVLRKWVKKHRFHPATTPILPVSMSVLEDIIDVTCPFLIKENDRTACAIYDIRPEICHEFNCRHAITGDISDTLSHDKKVVSVRREVFDDKDAITLKEYILLLDYVKKRPNAKEDSNE